nr:histidinol dehydrogenase [Solirubrobacterales bacterium]
ALAYGTETVAAVDVIAGPGGPWVQEAKLQVSRVVGIDGYAGPSELMVVGDENANAEWAALDLCAQAEHGADGVLVAAGPQDLLAAIAVGVERIAAGRPSVQDACIALVEVASPEVGLALAEALAPEHLQLDCAGAAELAEAVTSAGCVFVGARSGAAFGDYAAGSNHVLPTGGSGRFRGPLGPGTFRRRLSRVEIGADAAAALAPAVDVFARAEGFPVHGESARVRANGPGEQAS